MKSRSLMWKTVMALLAAIFLGPMTLAQTKPVPLINEPLVPDAVAPGGSEFTLTVNGTGFISASVLNWNGSALATTFVNSAQLTASVPASDIAKAGTASVTAVNPGPGGGTSNVAPFPIALPNPSITLSRSDIPIGSAGPPSVAAADLNGDGKVDAVLPNFGNTVSILLVGAVNQDIRQPCASSDTYARQREKKRRCKMKSRFFFTGGTLQSAALIGGGL